jgi:putative glutamine amidotransferase
MKKIRRPIIGVTADLDGKIAKIKCDYIKAIRLSGGEPIIITPLNDIDIISKLINGLLITGGDDLDPNYYGEKPMIELKLVSKKRSDFEFSILKRMVFLKKPILGICYGMQLINVLYGGSLYQDIALQLSVKSDHRRGYHKIYIRKNKFFKEGCYVVNSTHHQAIRRKGKNISVFAYSLDNLIEGIYKRDYPFLVGVQWHPERIMFNRLSTEIFNKFIEFSNEQK